MRGNVGIHQSMKNEIRQRASNQKAFAGSLLILIMLVGIFFSPTIFKDASIYDVDLRHVQTPIKWFLFKEKNRGFFPLWTDYMGRGYPIHAYGEGGLFYPLNWLVYPILPIPVAHDVTIMMHLLIAGVGMLFLSRKYHRNAMSSLVSAVVFMFSGYMIIHFGHLNSIQVYAWMPWTFNALEASKKTRWPFSASWIALPVALMLLAGRPQIAFYVWIALTFHGVAICIRRPYSVQPIVVILSGTILGLMIAAPQIMPTFEFIYLSNRSSGMAYEAQLLGTVSWHQLLWFVAPLWGKEYTYGVASESVGYVGMVTGILMICSFWNARQRAYSGWWVMLAFSLVLTMGDSFPLNAWIYQIPGFSYFRAPARWLSISSFAASILAGYGSDKLLKLLKDIRFRNILGIMIVMIVFMDLNYFIRPIVSFVDRKAQEAVPQALPILSGGGRYLSLNTTPIFVQELKAKRISPEHYTEFFSKRETLKDNLGMRYGLSSVDFYAGLHPRWTGKALSQLTSKSLSQMNCEFLISGGPIPGSGLKELWRSPFFRIYRNESVEPRAKLAAEIVQKGDHSFVSKGTIKGLVRIRKDKSHQKITLEVKAEEDGYLLLADTFYPGWKVSINGKDVEVVRANGWMRAVPILSGMSVVTFIYRPLSFLWGLAFGLFGIIVAVILIICKKERFSLRNRVDAFQYFHKTSVPR